MPSACVGILGDINKFNIAGDGTYMPTNASHYGKKICDCNWNGVNPVTVNANILTLLHHGDGIVIKNNGSTATLFIALLPATASMTCRYILNVLPVNAMIVLRACML